MEEQPGDHIELPSPEREVEMPATGVENQTAVEVTTRASGRLAGKEPDKTPTLPEKSRKKYAN